MISEQSSSEISSVTDVIVTTEYQGLNPSGGIGTVVEEQRECLGADRTLVLLVTPVPVDDERAERCQVLHAGNIIPASERSDLPADDQALRCLQIILRSHPNVRAVHVQDYSGIGCRLVQAKRAGLLPPSVSVIVHCHGATFYLEHGLQRWFGSSHFGIAEAEKIAIERADLTVFPSQFLKDLYAHAGIVPDEGQTVIVPYPYRFPARTYRAGGAIDTLIFIGKRSRMKGFPLFLETLDGERGRSLGDIGIRRVVIVGPESGSGSDNEPALTRLRSTFEVVETGGLPRADMLLLLEENAHRALCVIPYLADNQPLTVLDVIQAGVLPVLAGAGGLPEMVGQEAVIAAPNPASFRDRIASLAALPAADRDALRKALIDEQTERQVAVSQAYRTMSEREMPIPDIELDATVIVPFYNTPIIFVEELVDGLNSQEKAPVEVVFVDDASPQDAVTALFRMLERKLRWPWRIVSKPTNEGLAAARQTGFLSVDTPIVINVDSDDVPLPNFVADIVQAFVRNPGIAAVVPYLQMHKDDQPSVKEGTLLGVYRPLGEGVIASQSRNQLGHANAGFDRRQVLESGGWDGANRAMWEDFALFMQLVSGGAQVAIVPRVGCLYRVRADSMARTYAKWPAQNRVASQMKGLSRFESLRLQAFSRAGDTRAEELETALERETRETRRVLGEWERQTEETQRVLREWERQTDEMQRLVRERELQTEETQRVLQECERQTAETQRVLGEWKFQKMEASRILGEWIVKRDRVAVLEAALNEEVGRTRLLMGQVEELEVEKQRRRSTPWSKLARGATQFRRRLGRNGV